MPKPSSPRTKEAAVIAHAMHEHGITNIRLADVAGVHESFISQLKNGTRKVPWNMASIMAVELKVSAEDISEEYRDVLAISQPARLDLDTLSQAIQVLIDTSGEPTMENLMRIYHGIANKAAIIYADEKRKRIEEKRNADKGRGKGTSENTGRKIHKK